MSEVLNKIFGVTSSSSATVRTAAARRAPSEYAGCFHCGDACIDSSFAIGERIFCCQGCLIVHDLLAENGLEHFYDLSRHPGVRTAKAPKREQWAFLDDPVLQQRLVDFTDGAF